MIARPARQVSYVAAAAAVQLLLWQLVASRFGGGSIIPPPLDVLRALVSSWSSQLQSSEVTLEEAALGFALGVGMGLLLGLVAVLSEPIERTILRVAVVLTSIPIIALAPVLVIAFGSGLLSKSLLAALACFFTSLVTYLLGLRRPSPQQLAVFDLYRASWLDVLRRLRVPAAMPSLVVACKLAAPAAVLGAILGEWSGADAGLGVLMLSELRNYQVGDLWATVLVITVISVAGYGVFALLERPVSRWAS